MNTPYNQPALPGLKNSPFPEPEPPRDSLRAFREGESKTLSFEDYQTMFCT